MNTEYLNLIIGLGGILVGILASYIFYRLSLRLREPRYAIRSANLIEDFTSRFEGIVVTYNGEQISNCTSVKIAFWNNGMETIREDDVADADPIKIVVKEGYKILDVNLVYAQKDANQLKVTLADKKDCAFIQFDYLDYAEGGIIQLLHTGKKAEDVFVIGTVKGSHNQLKGVDVSRYDETSFSHLFRHFLYRVGLTPTSTLLTSIACAIIILIPFLSQLINSLHNITLWYKLILDSLPFLLMLSVCTYVGFVASKRDVPKEFDIFGGFF